MFQISQHGVVSGVTGLAGKSALCHRQQPLKPKLTETIMTKTAHPNLSTKPASAFSPFGHGAFAMLWTAATLSHMGTWMHEVGAGWLMADMTGSPLWVALVRTATTIPMFFFALFAGALADRMDRRRYLMIVNALLALVAVTMAIMAALDAMTPVLLLTFTFLLGTGIAFLAPAWQSIMPYLVPRPKLAPALALNSLSINLSRAIGPAVAGYLIFVLGAEAPFLANGISFVAVAIAVTVWKAEDLPAPKKAENSIWSDVKAGLSHARTNKDLKNTLVRSTGFFAFASAFWAMLPVIAREAGGDGSVLLGNLISVVGLGAVSGAFLLPSVRRKLSINRIAQGGAVFMGLSLIGLGVLMANAAYLRDNLQLALMGIAYFGGMGWIGMMTSLHLAAQTSLPDWVRARGLALHLMILFGGLAVGSALWGYVAGETSTNIALISAGLLLLVAQLLLARFRLTALQ